MIRKISEKRIVPMKTVLLLLLRRDLKDLSSQEREGYENAFPRCKVKFQRIDPPTYIEHAELCEQLQATAVILPLERPIPSMAMEKGVPHLVFTPNGVQQLIKLDAIFAVFCAS